MMIRGALIAASGAVILGTNGLIIRQVESATVWEIIFYRSIGLVVGLSTLFLLRYRGQTILRLRRVWKIALLFAPLQGMATIFYIMAITSTTIAAATLPLSCVPVFAAALGWLILSERPSTGTLLALIATSCGVGVMTIAGIVTGEGAGSILALASAMSFALYLVLVRGSARHGNDMLPLAIMGTSLALIVSSQFAIGLEITVRDILICLSWGAIVQAYGAACLLHGARHLRVADLSLLTVIEATSNPILVWLFIGERPGPWTLGSGAFTVIAVTIWSVCQSFTTQSVRRKGE